MTVSHRPRTARSAERHTSVPLGLAPGVNGMHRADQIRTVGEMITYCWRGLFSNDALNALHAEGFGHQVRDDDWWGQVNNHSLGWVCAQEGPELVGFVNVAWDGAVHAFIL